MSLMNDAQIIFTLFFAISWGIVSNVLPRWKPFHYAFMWPSKIRPMSEPVVFYVKWHPAFNRLIASWILLNVLPWCLFIGVLIHLSGDVGKVNCWHSYSTFWLILRAMVPGMIPFGSYHLWLALIHFKPLCFYFRTQTEVPKPFRQRKTLAWEEHLCEPDARSLGLRGGRRRNRRGGLSNLAVGIAYLIVAWACVWWH